MLRPLLVAVVVLAGCTDRRSKPAPRDVAPRPVLAGATQHDLAKEIDDAERRGTWREVRRRWEGQVLHWTVTRQRALCRTPERCHVMPFAIQRPAQYGWLPALELSPVEHAKIETACGAAEQCQLELEGTLRELVLSGDLPTSLRFANVRVIGGRPSAS
jgi:hypothetical protein